MNLKEKSLIFIRKILLSAVPLLVAFFMIPINALAAIKVPVDTSIEPNKDAGTDLYESKCYYHNALPLNISISSGQDSSVLHDEKYSTSIKLDEGTLVTVSSETKMHGLYIIWDSMVPEWTLKIGDNSYTYGKYNFLHEYIELPEETNELTIVIPNAGDQTPIKGLNKMRISDIMAFDTADVPIWVQKWEPTCEEADILAFSTHSDDEQIFLGGITPIYQAEKNMRVQFAFFTTHWNGYEPIREHEKLNGLWLAGAKYYPIMGIFDDAYSKTYEGAAQTINEDEAALFETRIIRRVHPQVVVTQDYLNGEYGHGQHIFMATNTIKAVEFAADENYDPDSVAQYGVWNVLKFYVHLNSDEPTVLDMRSPLESFGGKRAIDVARQAYLCHQTQQWCDFSVDDYGPYSAANWGLYKTNVGPDVAKNDLMENLTSYDEQERIRLEEEEKLRLEEEKKKAEEEEKARLEKEALEKEQAEKEDGGKDKDKDKKKDESGLSGTEIFVIAAIIVIVLMAGGFVAYFIVSNNQKKKRRKKRRR
jgi:LmbE family N-acetylglucosaminyl deacetylase